MPVVSSIFALGTAFGSTVAAGLGASATVAGVAGTVGGIAAVGAAGYGAVKGFQSLTDGGEGPDASGVTQSAADIAARTKQAEALAEQKAREEARKKLSQQTKTIFTSGLGVLGTKDSVTGKSTLGNN